MANSRTSKPTYEKVVIDTAPGADGYWTNVVTPRGRGVDKLFLSVAETGDSSAFMITVTLQYRPPGDTEWQVYDTYTSATREIIEDNGSSKWRAGVDNGDYTSGEGSITLDW